MVMEKNARIYVAGHKGLVGSALVRGLTNAGYTNIITRTRYELDLRHEAAVRTFFQQQKPDYVFLAAALVGGIMANKTFPVEFLGDNLAVQNNVMLAGRDAGVQKLLFLGSSCIYPKMCPQPIREEYLLNGALEMTNSAYAIAKIAGIEMCHALRNQYGCDYIAVMPTNLYGPNDNFNLNSSHVLPALLRKAHTARERQEAIMTVWGTGTPRREFLHADDLADACIYLMNHYSSDEIVNIGTGEDISIAELAHLIADITGYAGSICFDTSKPDGTPRKVLDVSRLSDLGWNPRIGLREGITSLYQSVDKTDWVSGIENWK
jgi:GDP-L-fucose synthase